MIELKQELDIWRMHDRGHIICITTNYGWTREGSNVMGAGLAKQAKSRYPDLPITYGKYCKEYHAEHPLELMIPSYYLPEYRFFMCASKPLNKEAPWLAWQHNATLEQVAFSAWTLAQMAKEHFPKETIYLTRFGCSNGKLGWKFVKPVLSAYLSNKFVVCNYAAPF